MGGTQNTATGLTHLGAREYQPSTGRFISADPILDAAQPQQWNGYAYSDNSPTNLSDPTGLRPDGSCGGAGYCNVGTASSPRAETWTYEGDGDWSWGWSGSSTQTWSEGDTSYTVTSYVHYNQHRGYSFEQTGVQAAPVKRDVTFHGYAQGSNPNYDPSVSDDWIQRPPLNTWQVIALGAVAAVGTAAVLAPVAPVLVDGAADIGLACLRNPAKCAEVTGEAATGGAAGGSLPGASAAGIARAEASAESDLDALIASACKNSFPGTTPVLTAAGTPKPIEDIKVGDTVRATNPLTGVTQPQKVTAVIKTLTDTDFTDTTIATPDGPRTLTSTQHHPYWNETRHRWTNAADLRAGEELRSPDGHTQRITRVRNYTAHIVTYNLTVSDLHTYYVLAGNTPVLVHNTDGDVCGIRPTPMQYNKPGSMQSAAYDYQRSITGLYEFQVTGGGERVWADGIDGTTLVDAKYTTNPKSSPYTGTAPDFVNRSTIDEIRRYGAVINDPATRFTNLRVVTNTPEGVTYFTGLMEQLNIAGQVILRR
ncbi:polymorphic toxin-type HINT domain-containing protein [Streptomyces sp. NPDC059819]|uniref:polymorphic toxin-type HINT domain-containing protein n=1 Tax=Streptomyces sp. NPDC059819 TaxID=3346963 RepID=UPI0036502C58